MKYEVVKSCVIKGKPTQVGEIVDLEDGVAKGLMAIGRIVPADESKLEDRSIGLSKDTKPKRRSKKVVEKVVEEVVEEPKEEAEEEAEEE